MKIEFDTVFFFNNHENILKETARIFNIGYPITKDESDFKLKQDEVMFLKIKGGKFNRKDTRYVNNANKDILHEGRIVRTNVTSNDIEEVDIAITNKYLHMYQTSNHKTLPISKITAIYINPKNIVVYTSDRSYTIITNSYQLGLQVTLLLDVIKNIKVDDSFVGRTINLNKNQ